MNVKFYIFVINDVILIYKVIWIYFYDFISFFVRCIWSTGRTFIILVIIWYWTMASARMFVLRISSRYLTNIAAKFHLPFRRRFKIFFFNFVFNLLITFLFNQLNHPFRFFLYSRILFNSLHLISLFQLFFYLFLNLKINSYFLLLKFL